MATRDATVPERPRKLRSRVAIDGSRLTIAYRAFDSSGVALLFWLIAWTVGCVFLVANVIQNPTVFSVVLAIPFLAAWVFVFCTILNSFFRRDLLELALEGIQYERRVIVMLQQRTIPLEEIQGVRSYERVVDSESGTRQWGLEIQTAGLGLRFGDGLPEAERIWLVHQLNEHLRRLNPAVDTGSPGITSVDEAPAISSEEAKTARETLALAASPLKAPSDSRWFRTDGFQGVAFECRGRFSFAAVGGLLFFNAFWNGIVSVFLCQLFLVDDGLEGSMWWGMLVFLIPFEAIGLVMFAGLLAALAEPFHHTRWVFSYGGVQRHTSWFGIGPRRDYPVDWLDRVELQPYKKSPFSAFAANGQEVDKQGDRRLVFIDRQNVECFSIDALSEGEARWIADTVLRECRRWFA